MNNKHICNNPFDQIQQQKRDNFELEKHKEEKRRSWIQFWIPTTISLVALLRPEIAFLIKALIELCSKE